MRPGGGRLAAGGPGGLTKGFRAAAVDVRCGGGSGSVTRGEDSSMALRERGDGARQTRGRRKEGGEVAVRMTCVGGVREHDETARIATG